MPSRLLGELVVIGVLLVAACGDDSRAQADAQVAIDAAAPDGPADAAPQDTAPPGDAAPADAAPLGSVTIRASGVTGATGKVVLVGVTPHGVAGFQGAVCEPVTSDPLSFTAVAKTPTAGNPCDLGAIAVFADGAYDVLGGLYTPGNTTPDLCANTTVTVAGTGDVTLPAFGACP
jgi:hypothetical protein